MSTRRIPPAEGPLAAIFRLIEEGVDDSDQGPLAPRIAALTPQDFEQFRAALVVYAQNLADDLTIPETILDDDGAYARARQNARDLVPRVAHLMGLLRMPWPRARTLEDREAEGGG
jgi:hypothetical protein